MTITEPKIEELAFGASKYTAIMPAAGPTGSGPYCLGSRWKFLVAGRIMGGRVRSTVTTTLRLYKAPGSTPVATSVALAPVGSFNEALFPTPIAVVPNDEFIIAHDSLPTYYAETNPPVANVSANMAESPFVQGHDGAVGTFPGSVSGMFFHIDIIWQVGSATTISPNLSLADQRRASILAAYPFMSTGYSMNDSSRYDLGITVPDPPRATLSITDLARYRSVKPASNSMADQYTAINGTGANKSLADKCAAQGSGDRTYADVAFVKGS